jgi:rubrerythrin
VAHQFPEITAYGSAFGFAIEAERACADFAAAAQVLAPSDEWRAKLDEVACMHDDRVQKLTTIRQEVNEMILEPIHSLDGSAYLGTLDAEPESSWPAAVEQLIRAEEDAARFHEDFVAQCEQILAASARAFRKAAKQDRDTAAQLREMLG